MMHVSYPSTLDPHGGPAVMSLEGDHDRQAALQPMGGIMRRLLAGQPVLVFDMYERAYKSWLRRG